MKRTTAILLLCIFTFNLVGFFFVFEVQQYQVRKEIKECLKQGVPENQLSLITVTSKNEYQLHWEYENEFRYEGIMYDVVKKEIVDDHTTIFYCITDKQETTLFANLSEQIKKNITTGDDESNPLANLFEELLSVEYYLPQKSIWTLFPTQTTITYEYLYRYSSPVFDIVTPPPKTA